MSKENPAPVLLGLAGIGLNVTGIAGLIHSFYFGSSAGLFASGIAFGIVFYVVLITFLYFVSRRHEDERKKKAGPFRPGLWCSALRIYLGKSSSATSATLRSPYIAR